MMEPLLLWFGNRGRRGAEKCEVREIRTGRHKHRGAGNSGRLPAAASARADVDVSRHSADPEGRSAGYNADDGIEARHRGTCWIAGANPADVPRIAPERASAGQAADGGPSHEWPNHAQFWTADPIVRTAQPGESAFLHPSRGI